MKWLIPLLLVVMFVVTSPAQPHRFSEQEADSHQASAHVEAIRTIDGDPLLVYERPRPLPHSGIDTRKFSTPAPCPPRLVAGEKYRVVSRFVANVSAYNSLREQTDNSPGITSTGAAVYCGVVAANGLSRGKTVRFPELYGEDTLFFVEDRMKCVDGEERCRADSGDRRIDIWFPYVQQAREFGRHETEVEVVEPRARAELAR